MKKCIKMVISVLMMCALVAMLSACGGKEESATCRLDVGGGNYIEVKIDAKGDIITKWTQTTYVSTEGMDDATIAYFETKVEEMKNIYSQYSNVEYSSQVGDGSVQEVLTIDMTDKDSVQKLVDDEILPVEGNATRLSLKQTVENLEASGYVVQ